MRRLPLADLARAAFLLALVGCHPSPEPTPAAPLPLAVVEGGRALTVEKAYPPEEPPGPAGVGIVSVPVEPGVRVALYDAPGDPAPSATLALSLPEPNGAFDFDAPKWLRPEVVWLDYGQLLFRVVAQVDGGYRVLARAGGGTVWIPRSEPVSFRPWAAFLLDATVLNRVDPAANPLRRGPGGAPAAYTGNECLRAVEVRGDWARVAPSEVCSEAPPAAAAVDGLWLRWRDGDDLLVHYYTSC